MAVSSLSVRGGAPSLCPYFSRQGLGLDAKDLSRLVAASLVQVPELFGIDQSADDLDDAALTLTRHELILIPGWHADAVAEWVVLGKNHSVRGLSYVWVALDQFLELFLRQVHRTHILTAWQVW